MSKIYLVNGNKKLDETVDFSEDMKGDVYSSQHVIPLAVAFQVARLQGSQDVHSVSELNVHSVPLNNYSLEFNVQNLLNTNRRALVNDLRRVSSFIESKSLRDSIIVLNRPHYDGLHYFLFNDIQFPVSSGKTAKINHFSLDFIEDSKAIIANSSGYDSLQFDSLTDKVNQSYKNMRWRNVKF
ncbi:hypothetical protein JXA48_01765 [Candidatus Woesearchaeota archaeon]|nr:hypothetical protein [Candidatus Woesearchaeota archaeon]